MQEWGRAKWWWAVKLAHHFLHSILRNMVLENLLLGCRTIYLLAWLVETHPVFSSKLALPQGQKEKTPENFFYLRTERTAWCPLSKGTCQLCLYPPHTEELSRFIKEPLPANKSYWAQTCKINLLTLPTMMQFTKFTKDYFKMRWYQQWNYVMIYPIKYTSWCFPLIYCQRHVCGANKS